MVTNRKVRGTIARRISAAKTDAEINHVLADLRIIADRPSKLIREFTDEVITHPQLPQVIERIRLFDDVGSGQLPLQQLLVNRLHLPPDIDHKAVIEGLLGWIQQACTECWNADETAWITLDAFNRQLHHLVRYHKQAILIRALCDIAIPPNEHAGFADAMFVQQIRLLEFSDETGTILDAITDFLAARAERRRLAETGEQVRSEYERFIDELCVRFQRFRTRHSRDLERDGIDYPSRALAAGRAIMDSTLERCGVSIGGADVPLYLSCGEYHRLADTGEKVGWHPDYRKLLKIGDPT